MAFLGVFELKDCQRFASIMILSVLRNTNSTVKFWFIENFLSPSFLVGLRFLRLFQGQERDQLIGIYPTLRARVRVPIRARDLQMALVVTCSEGETTDYLGVQDLVPRRALSYGLEESHLR